MKIMRQRWLRGWRLSLIWTLMLSAVCLAAGNAGAEQATTDKATATEQATGGKDDGTCRNDYSQCFKERLPIQEMRATAYTAAFAKRFGLEPPAPGTEPGNGLEALEIKVERREGRTDDPYCMKLSLYLDSRLPIKLSENGPSGSQRIVLNSYHFFGNSFKERRFEKWPEEDKHHMVALESKYNMKAFLASMDYEPHKKGALDSITYDEYHTELLPGLTYIRLTLFVEPILGKPYTDVGVFLQRTTDTDYRQRITIYPGEFLKFRLPDHILTKMKEWRAMMKPVNAAIRKEWREQREQATKKQQPVNP